MELAIAWTLARRTRRGMPESVVALMDSVETLGGAKVLMAIPELRTALPGGFTSSQTDLFALLHTERGLIGLSVEGKAMEPFGDTVDRWMGSQRPDRPPPRGRLERLEFLSARLGLDVSTLGPIRYQLLHRTVAALLEAEHWGATAAVMLVQRFAQQPASDTPSWSDFCAFAGMLNAEVSRGRVVRADVPGTTPLYLAWLDCQVASDEELVSVFTDRSVRVESSRNAFEVLCQRANEEKWCWKLTCTTCGCMHFRYGLLEVSKGTHPSSGGWITSTETSSERLRQKLGTASLPLPIGSQQEVINIASKAKIQAIAANGKFPDWLGYLGVLLSFCRDVETESSSLTRAWTPQLCDMLPKESTLRQRLQTRAAGSGLLTLDDLEAIERELERSPLVPPA
jgi:hypothetical protein